LPLLNRPEGAKEFFIISSNVGDIRSFSRTKRKKNLGEGRAEPQTVYPLLYAPSEMKCSKSAARSSGVKRSEEVDLEARLFTIFIYKKTQRRSKE